MYRYKSGKLETNQEDTICDMLAKTGLFYDNHRLIYTRDKIKIAEKGV